MLDRFSENCFEGMGPIAVAVIGQDPLDGDSLGLESGIGARPERGHGSFFSLVRISE